MVFIITKPSNAESGLFGGASPFHPKFYILSQVLLSIVATEYSAAALPQILIQTLNKEIRHLMLHVY